MSKEFSPEALDIRAFAKSGAELEGVDALQAYERLADGLPPSNASDEAQARAVRWGAQGRTVEQAAGAAEVWLDLQVEADIPQVCQRCLQPVQTTVHVDRSFLFVEDERTAGELDEDSEDDVLVISRRFDLRGLVEDEVLMALPIVPQHDICPTELKWQAEDEGFAEAEQTSRRQPFAALDVLKKKL